jgi:hypothetical protein
MTTTPYSAISESRLTGEKKDGLSEDESVEVLSACDAESFADVTIFDRDTVSVPNALLEERLEDENCDHLAFDSVTSPAMLTRLITFKPELDRTHSLQEGERESDLMPFQHRFNLELLRANVSLAYVEGLTTLSNTHLPRMGGKTALYRFWPLSVNMSLLVTRAILPGFTTEVARRPLFLNSSNEFVILSQVKLPLFLPCIQLFTFFIFF